MLYIDSQYISDLKKKKKDSQYIYIKLYIMLILCHNILKKKKNFNCYKINIVGLKDLGAPVHFNIKLKAQAKEENVRG